MSRPALLLVVALTGALAGCGGDSPARQADDDSNPAYERAIADARHVGPGDFPATRGRTLEQLARTVPAVDFAPATSTFVPGANRLAFGLIDRAKRFVYGKTAVYVARRPGGRARGPFPAPADGLVVEPPFRSRGAANGPAELAAIYDARVRLDRPGRWYVLALTRTRRQRVGAAGSIEVARSSPIPAVGRRPPRVRTDTLATAGGDSKSIDTRVPPDDMHEQDFAEVLGKKPVALLYSTPALCESRVCGPVTDIAAQLQKEFGDRITFIHQEVFVDNTVEKGLRAPLRRFGLQTEPWLFTFDAQGRVAARLEGSFGIGAFRAAVRSALR